MTTTTELSKRTTITAIVAEYEAKLQAIPSALKAFQAAGDALKDAATVAGTWGEVTIATGHVYERDLTRSLLKSAWLHTFTVLSMDYLASAADKKRFKQSMENPPDFNFETVKATFGPYLEDPRHHILRGLAEAFAALDPVYKSHEKVKIGVQGLPKRVILSYVGSWGSWGAERLRDCINALCAVKGLPLTDWNETRDKEGRVQVYGIRQLLDDGDYMRKSHDIWLKRYANGNGHLCFGPTSLLEINRALAEYYGEVLPDAVAKGETVKKRAGTAVCKDLQYYATPQAVIDRLLEDVAYRMKGASVLEPSCGDGRIMVAAKAAGAAKLLGIEVDPGRAEVARAKGLPVMTANFLETEPTPEFDFVLMNPPFAGRHYAQHVLHAYKFLKPGGTLRAIVPFTAREHGLLDQFGGRWEDLPMGSFRESGTNINTVIFTARAKG